MYNLLLSRSVYSYTSLLSMYVRMHIRMHIRMYALYSTAQRKGSECIAIAL